MSHIFETRCVSANLADPKGVARVACIGDSMLYGFGGPARDAMPAHLGNILNAAHPDRLVFVDNFGHTSGNIWNSWPLFKANAERMRFDAVVFSVCQNDLELFDSNLVRYGVEGRKRTFDAGTPTWEACSAMLADIAQWTRERRIDALIVFYTYFPPDRPLIDRMAAGCEAAGVAFLDMLKFLREETGLTNKTYVVSEFDSHPSSLAHETVARRVAREMRSLNFLAAAPRMTAGPRASVIAAARSMVSQGMHADDALNWASELCDTKATALRRLGGGGETKDIAAWKRTKAWVLGALSAWRTGLRQTVRGRALETAYDSVENNFANLAGNRRRFEDLAYVLAHPRPGAEPADLYRLFDGTAHRTGGKIKEFDGSISLAAGFMAAKIESLKERLGIAARPGEAARRLLRLNGALPLDKDAGLSSQLAREIDTMDRAVSVFVDYASRTEEPADPGVPAQFLRALSIFAFKQFLVHAEKLADTADAALPLALPQGPPYTIVQVTVEGAVGATVEQRTFELAAVGIYETPRRGAIRNRCHAGAVKDREVYRLEFPLMLAGRMIVGPHRLSPNRDIFLDGRARIADIRIGNADAQMNIEPAGRVVEWRNEGENAVQVDLPILLS